jgi:hypothetical protein
MLKKGTEKPQGSTLSNNGTQKKSLNNYEVESNNGKRSVVASPHLHKKQSQPDQMSMRSGNPGVPNVQSLYNFREKENMTGSQVNTLYVTAKGLTHEQVMAVLDAQIKSKGDTLDLSGLGLTDEAMKSLEKPLADLKGFKVLKLGRNQLTDTGLRSALRGICKLALHSLFLTDNSLGEYALNYCISLRRHNTAIRSIYITGNPLISSSDPKTKKMVALLQHEGVNVYL